ncbi:stage II sporulation protein M [Marinicrinis sediminis]|uniref:Stage II sporulation protein M n=1 Tax=Marinicrinis sediminis TaxID=1652465 RepID=A0ABW5RCJ8_9BACL
MKQALMILREDLKVMKWYFLFGSLLFIASMVLGYSYEPFHQMLDEQLQQIGEVAQDLNEKDNKEHWFFAFIFLNNAIKGVLIIFAGLLLGLLPLLFIVMNGMILGYLYMSLEQAGESALLIFVKGILPHGIIELPVIIVAASYGLRMGVLALQALGRRSGNRQAGGMTLSGMFKVSLPLSLLIAGALFVAALIEAYLTPLILQ